MTPEPPENLPLADRSHEREVQLPAADELRELVDRSCRRHEDQATQAMEACGSQLEAVVYQMLLDDLVEYDESRGEFAAWLIAELIIADLLRHPDERLLVNWISVPPFPSCSEEGPEAHWYIESQRLSESLRMDQIISLFLLALQSSCETLRRRAERAWQAIRSISGSEYNPRGSTLNRHFHNYRDQMIEALTLAAQDENVELRDAAEWALAVCRDPEQSSRSGCA